MNKKSRKTRMLSRRLIALLLCCICLMGVAPISAIALESDAAPAAEETAAVEPMEEIAVVPEVTATPAPTVPSDSEISSVNVGSSEQESILQPESTIEPTPEAEPEGTPIPQSFYDEVMATQSCQAMYELISDDANYDKASTLTVEQVYAIRDYAQSLGDDGYQEILVQTLNELLKYLGEDIDSEYGTELDGDLNEGMYNGSVNVYWDTITSLSPSASSTGGVNVNAVTLGGSPVTQGSADDTWWSGGSQLSTYFPGAFAYNMKDAPMTITAETGYYVTGVVVACAPTPGGETLNPFNCGTWKSSNEFIQNFNLTSSTYSNGKYTLSFKINSRFFSHDGGTSPKAYFILITTAAVPTPLYVEYSYGDVEADSNSAFSKPTWTVAASGNNYGSGSLYQSGVLTPNTQFAYQYPAGNTGVIANWTHKANFVSEDALKEAAAKGYHFTGWKATWYNECTESPGPNNFNDDYILSFSKEYMTGSCAPNDPVQLPTNVRLVAQWEYIPPTTATVIVTKQVTGLLGDKTKPFTFKYSYNGEDQSEAFDLKDGESKELAVPVGTTLKITETNAEGYTTTYSINGDNAVSAANHSTNDIAVSGNCTIAFVNSKNASPDTGVLLDSMPYVIILVAVAAGAAGSAVLKKRKHGEDE